MGFHLSICVAPLLENGVMRNFDLEFADKTTLRAQTDYFRFAGDTDISTRMADSVASVSLLSGPSLDMDCLPLFFLPPTCTSILGTRTT
jgi:hypothetical protein